MKNYTFFKLFFVFLVFFVWFFPVARAENSTKIQGGKEYILGAEDVIEVLIWKEEDLSRTVIIRPDGKISLPLTGDIQAAGLKVEELKENIAGKLKEFVDNPTVTVIVLQMNSMKIYVQGEVNQPGDYQLSSNMTVLQAISLAGGLTEWANKNKIIIVREEQGRSLRIRVNYDKIVWGKENSRSLFLERGDIIIVP